MNPDSSVVDTPLRLFVGTFLSGQQQQALGKLQEHNEQLTALWQRKLRWVKPAKMHLTWLFLGTMERTQIAVITRCLKGLVLNYSPVEMVYDRFEFWPLEYKPRQWVLTPRSAPPEVQELGQDIRAGLSHITAKPDRHPFRPHVTLLRFEPGPGHARAYQEPLELPDWLNLSKVLPVRQTITSICLVESHVGRLSDGYTILETFQLACASPRS